ncbi:hypothetical protein GOBAR_AA26404 [Gossypium barbadense]|uniref:Uncharacterized protein n=1 Tax=Gossypium barbadense TaxID=3634 RepID=A0A2P5WT66_GOSBA|nr:hypothetical protein GOBAR_AA26404 [Gossypium barbadense]
MNVESKCGTVSELEQEAGKNKNSRTQQERSFGQKVGCFQLFDITHRKKDGSPMTSEAREIMEKLKDKKAEYEAIASSDSSVNHEDIDNRIITGVLGPERYGRQYMPLGSQVQVEVQRLRDQIAQMQANTVEQIAQLRGWIRVKMGYCKSAKVSGVFRKNATKERYF